MWLQFLGTMYFPIFPVLKSISRSYRELTGPAKLLRSLFSLALMLNFKNFMVLCKHWPSTTPVIGEKEFKKYTCRTLQFIGNFEKRNPGLQFCSDVIYGTSQLTKQHRQQGMEIFINLEQLFLVQYFLRFIPTTYTHYPRQIGIPHFPR